MGQKVSPTGFRVGVKIKTPGETTGTSNVIDWSSRWYANKSSFGDLLIEDQVIREFIKYGNSRKNIYNGCASMSSGRDRRSRGQEKGFSGYRYAGIPKIEIERFSDVDFDIDLKIQIARPGLIIGKKGKNVELLTKDLEQITGKSIKIQIIEIKNPELNAVLVAENVAEQLERRASFRRVLKKTVESVINARAEGVKIEIAGRLGGAEMARREKINRGTIPLQTLRANIDYGFAEANTTYGNIGVKTWIYKGDIITTQELNNASTKKSKA